MPWLLPLLQIAASFNPAAAAMMQGVALLDAAEVERRLTELEDPISTLHPDVPGLARELYARLGSVAEGTSTRLTLEEEFVDRYLRPLSRLESQGLIELRRVLGNPLPTAIDRMDPLFVGYLAHVAEDKVKVRRLVHEIEECLPGQWLRGADLAKDLSLPVVTVRSIMGIYESGGYGVLSRETGTANYLGQS